MSSKSKHRPAHPAPSRPGSKPAPAEPREGQERQELLSEDVIRIPRGMSKWQFVVMISLVIILLITFLVPNAIMGITGRGDDERNPVIARWNRPGHGPVEYRYSDIQIHQRLYADALNNDPFLSFGLGIESQRNLDTADIARLMMLDQLAQDAGLEVTDAELAKHLTEFLQFGRRTPEDFRAQVRMQGLAQGYIEEAIRRVLRAGRYLQVLASAAAIPDPAVIEELFHEENEEFAFEYVALPLDSVKEAARAELPDDTALETWFQALPEEERAQFRTEEERRADFVLFRGVESTPAAELVAAFPEQLAEGVEPQTPEQLADQYYRRVFHKRFVKPAEEEQSPEGEEAAADEEADEPPRPSFRSFDEVKEQCLAEAPIYFALQRWLDDLKTRKTAGETIDLAAEAARYGLEHRAPTEASTRDELAALPEIGDRELADAVFEAAPDGSFHYVVVPLESGLAIARTLERLEPVLPPFSDIRDRIAEKWVEPRAEELALERLKAIREGFEAFEPPEDEDEQELPPDETVHRRATAEVFRAAAETAGLELGTRDYLNRSGPRDADPDRDLPAHKHLAAQYELYQLETDEVAEPQVAQDEHAAYLVRVSGKREVPLERMTPVQYKRLEQSARSRAAGDLTESMDVAFFEKNYGLWLYQASEEEEGAAKEDAAQ